MENIEDYKDYKQYLRDKIRDVGRQGYQGLLAKAAKCQPSYFSRVLNSTIDLTPEHALGLVEFWGLPTQEAEYFLLLVDHSRAGTESLRVFTLRKIESFREKLQAKKPHFQSAPKIDVEKIYYSQWYYSALHILVSIPEYAETSVAAEAIGLSEHVAGKALKLLETLGIVTRKDDRWHANPVHIHAPIGSPESINHQRNWRNKSLDSAVFEPKNATHFTGIHSLSRKDANKIRRKMVTLIEEANQIVSSSKEETLVCMNLDFFSIIDQHTTIE